MASGATEPSRPIRGGDERSATAARAEAKRPPRLAGRLRALGRRLAALDAAARRFDVLLACTTEIPVDLAGDPRHRWGFRYDERDGTGIDRRPALVRHRGRGPADVRFLQVARTRRCLSAAPDPAGTGKAARASRRRASPGSRPLPRLADLEALAARVERRTERFDDWESCLSWVPVTEAGDRQQDLGYLRRVGRPARTRHDTAIAVDESEWDDPDYQLAAFAGRDRPFGPGDCDTEPGEEGFRLPSRRRGPAATAASSSAAGGKTSRHRERLDRLAETVEDLGEPVAEITRFDECMYTVGVRERGGYVFEHRGRSRQRPALSFDMRGHTPAQLDLMAFPGEEPPQIECNEDAGGEGTEE